MKDQITLDTELTNDLTAKLKTNRKKYLIRIAILIVINTIFFGLLIKGTRSTTENLLSALNANLIGFNLLGFLLGTIVAIFPYKGLPFKKKYLNASLMTILAIQIIMTIGLILIGIMTLMGWY
ncbi:hypothetical protein [Lutibacter citreus]|uniref:hypothetical protein n=1 Tax=Lutibacter citreus TaxID=2138210 RepID=UPI000DBE646B|nr:hypothetical protein [Lutibacter citreus]